MQDNRIVHPLFVSDGPRSLALLFTDGEMGFGPVDGFTINRSTQAPREAMHLVSGRMEPFRDKPGTEEITFSFNVREEFNPLGVQWLKHRGKAATLESRYRLRREVLSQILTDEAARKHKGVGLVQDIDATNFPAPSGVGETSPASGSLVAADSDNIQVVHCYVDEDVLQGGTALADFTVANFANMVRGEHYIIGPPSSNVVAAALIDNDKLVVSWTDATIPATMAYPNKTLVLVGADSAFATKKVAAIVNFGTLTADVTTLVGTTAIGASPVKADANLTQVGSVSGGARSWSALTQNTNYTYDSETGETTLVEGDANNGKTIRTHRWFHQAPQMQWNDNQAGDQEYYVGLRSDDVDTEGTDPDTARGTGDRWSIIRSNVMSWTVEALAASSDGFGGGYRVSGKGLKDPETNRKVLHEVYSPELSNFVDIYNRDVLAA